MDQGGSRTLTSSSNSSSGWRNHSDASTDQRVQEIQTVHSQTVQRTSFDGDTDDFDVFMGLVRFRVGFHLANALHGFHATTYTTKYCVLVVQPRLHKSKET